MLSIKSIIFFILIINIIFCFKFPLNEKIEESEQGNIKSIDIESTEEYLNYIKSYDYIIALFHVEWCGHCQQFLPVLDKASSYKILNKKWIFLKIDCSKYPNICSNIGIERYPTIKLYKKKELLHIETPRELVPLLELLNKLSENSIVKVNSKNEFFEKYGDFSPIIEILPKYEGKEEESDFYICIMNLANKEFIENFYFGVVNSIDNKEKIVFDYNGSNISYTWDGNCKNAFEFLYENKYPLLSKINSYFLKEIFEDSKILIFLITFPKTKKINHFIFSYFKQLSYDNRQYVFGYADYNEDKDISEYFNLKLNNTNEIKLIIYDFEQRMHYMHNETFNIEINNEKEIINKIQNVIKNINNIKYTTGSKIKDWINSLGFEKMSVNQQIIVVGIFVFGLLGIIFLFTYLSNSNDNSDSDSDSDEDDNDNDIIENKINQKEDIKLKDKKEIDKKKNVINKEKIE